MFTRLESFSGRFFHARYRTNVIEHFWTTTMLLRFISSSHYCMGRLWRPRAFRTCICRISRLSDSVGVNSLCYARSRNTSLVAEDAIKSLPDPINTILKRCLQSRPEKRPCFQQLSAWFDEICDSTVLDEENLRTFFGLDSQQPH